MSGFGMLATALAGGAGVIGKQAGDDIEQGRKADLMRQEADIREQAEKRLIEFRSNSARTSRQQQLVDDRAFSSSDETIAASGKVAAAAGKVARSETLLTKTDTALRDADTANADADSEAAYRRQRNQSVLKANDKEALAAEKKLLLNDPRIEAAVQASYAAAGANAAQQKMVAEQLDQLKKVGARAEEVRQLQGTIAGTSDPVAKDALKQKLSDLGFTGKDPAKFLSLAEKAQDNVAAGLRVLANPESTPEAMDAARRQIDDARSLSKQAAALGGIKMEEPAKPSQEKVHADALAIIAKGAKKDDVNARLKSLGYEPLPEKGKADSKPQRMIESSAPDAGSSQPAAERNPFVDKAGRVIPGSSAGGAGSLLNTTVAPALGRAVDSVGTTMNEQYKRSLQMKIERGEALSQGEQIRARQLGLMK